MCQGTTLVVPQAIEKQGLLSPATAVNPGAEAQFITSALSARLKSCPTQIAIASAVEARFVYYGIALELDDVHRRMMVTRGILFVC